MAVTEIPTVRITNLPQTVTASDLQTFLESRLGPDSVFAVEIPTLRRNWKPRSFARVQFASLAVKAEALALAASAAGFVFFRRRLALAENRDDVVTRPADARLRLDDAVLHAGALVGEDCLRVAQSWEGVRVWLMPERRRVEFWVWVGEECFKVEVGFEDVAETVGYCLDGEKIYAQLLKLKYGPKIYKRFSGPKISSRFPSDRYHICKEDFDFVWVRTTDFSESKSIGHSTSLCWELPDGFLDSDAFESFPFYREGKEGLMLEDTNELCSVSDIVPLVKCLPNSKLPYEILFQLNSLVHTQKIPLISVDSDLFELLGSLNSDTVNVILQKLHKLDSTCFDPLSFVETNARLVEGNAKSRRLVEKRLIDGNIMSCHRALITPTKIYCLGPDEETCNYVVKNFASHASDFLRVTFVDEDWGKLHPVVISVDIENNMFAKPYRTPIYHRILAILRDGITIGTKRYEFLAFSASQLRSNAVWMFASSENLKAEDIRQWMGCFKKIRSVSKCAARMGQLFSSSKQTLIVPARDVEIIPDVEVTTDGISYCFSDGIGKISLPFAKKVAQKLGLKSTPSAFQIRYGGYKGVIAVDRDSDRDSFWKLALRGSMLKFDSENRMLNVTKCSDPMPCYLNREIVTLLSTLGVKDEAFLALENEQLRILGKMRNERKAAINFLENITGLDSSNVILKMLHQGYEPRSEPYLSMMLQSHYESQLSDLTGRCRVFVPRGRVLLGCLDETGILEYGQVFVRIKMTKAELADSENQGFFRKLDGKTSVLVGKVVITKNPCLHPGDVRVLEAVYDVRLKEAGLVDCLVFPQKGERPHPNECSGGDLDGDLYFVSWDSSLIPPKTVEPMDYFGRRPRIMDHDVTIEEIQKFFVDYLVNDTLGGISTAHLVHADREPEKALSEKCLHLATLHSMAVDFAKTGAPAELPRILKPREFPDFMERFDKPTYVSESALGKLYRAALASPVPEDSRPAGEYYDHDLEVDGFTGFIPLAETHKEMYTEKMTVIMRRYGAVTEDEVLTGNFRIREAYLKRDSRRYGDMKDRVLFAVKRLQGEARGWFESDCEAQFRRELASAWYHVAYHPSYRTKNNEFLSFPWINSDVLLEVKSENSQKSRASMDVEV